jgi:hypothetical protein
MVLGIERVQTSHQHQDVEMPGSAGLHLIRVGG